MTVKKAENNLNSAQKPGDQEVPIEQQANEIPTLPITVLAQYIKDISFETPGLWSLMNGDESTPEISLNIEVAASPIAENRYEVELHIDASAKKGAETAFVMELVYAGLFELEDVDEQNIPPVLLIECPRLLFPFARSIVSELTREGGFPPLSLAPVDFAAIYHQKMIGTRQQTQSVSNQQ